MRRGSSFVLSSLFLIHLVSPTTTFPCTTFSINSAGQMLFGKNYDWNVDHGLLIVNKRGVARAASQERRSEGDVGLVIELMMLEASIYPSPDTRPAVGASENHGRLLRRDGPRGGYSVLRDSKHRRSGRVGSMSVTPQASRLPA